MIKYSQILCFRSEAPGPTDLKQIIESILQIMKKKKVLFYYFETFG